MRTDIWMTGPAGRYGLGGLDVCPVAGRTRFGPATRERLQGTGLPTAGRIGGTGENVRIFDDNSTLGFPPSRSPLS